MSQECQQPQAHPARCGCEQKKPYPDRLCHIDYTAHPYRCGCLKGNAEAQSRFDEHQHHAPVPSAGREVDNSPDGVKLEVFEIVCKERDALKAEVERLNNKYQRDVYGLNNEGDPIGGEPAGGYANDLLRAQSELTKARELNEQLLTELDRAKSLVVGKQVDLTKALNLLVAAETWMTEDGEVLANIQDFLAHQSAPAAKGEGDE